ncbi:MAG: 50S ribosomal protein L25 [Bacillota bacterium]
MGKHVLRADKRPVNTKHTVRELRKKGYVPGVLYGSKIGNIPIKIAERDLSRVGGAHVIEVTLPQGSYPAVIREIQKHPVNGEIRHVDLQQVDLNKKIRTEIPIQVTGTPVGIKMGGVLQLGERSVEVEALPAEIPDYLEADITALEIGDKYTVSDLQKTTPLKIISELDSVIAVVVAPRTAETIEEEQTAPELPHGDPVVENGQE